MKKITWDNKELGGEGRLGEFWVEDANEIKEAVNENADDLNNKAEIDGSNVNPSIWRSLLDVLTSGQINTLLEDYTPTDSLGGAALLDVGTTAGTVAPGTALQPGDNISSLVNDVGYLTSATLPPYPD